MSPRKTRDENKTRFTVWLPAGADKELERLQRELGKLSVSEVVRDAIEVYISLLKSRDRGIRLYYTDESTGQDGRVWLLPGPPPF
jgi:IS1 family transposase